MNYLSQHWGYPWIGALFLVVALIHERGLRSMNRRSTKEHARRRRRRMWFTYAGLVVAALSVVSPLQFWAMEYFWVHMLQHVSVMLAAPALYIAGAPFLPLLHSVPVKGRRRILRRVFAPGRRSIYRQVGAFLLSPIVAVGFFNLIMVLWMIPSLFNPVMDSTKLHIGLMLTTFFLSGVLFWLQIIPSKPFRPKLSPFGQVGALLFTNLVMTIIALILSFFTSVPWYSFGAAMKGMAGMVMGGAMPTITLSRLADQQIGAAILWVCGDFWCYPSLVTALRRAMSDAKRDVPEQQDSFSRLLRSHRNMSVEEFQAARSANAVTAALAAIEFDEDKK